MLPHHVLPLCVNENSCHTDCSNALLFRSEAFQTTESCTRHFSTELQRSSGLVLSNLSFHSVVTKAPERILLPEVTELVVTWADSFRCAQTRNVDTE
ncbi:hypothetical protein VZT92_006194 [Zoarces viviparus]|uniref:Uncharacterized protein n=1 Tax=Zoarces viviparus TaxID=48416 RepID=A0AAW1FNK4_ZOAVI